MGQYLDRIDAAAPADKWPLVRKLMTEDRQPFFAELRAERPVIGVRPLSERTYVTICQSCDDGILPPNEGIPLGRP